MLATVNPCGFAMLPAYISYHVALGRDDQTPSPLGALLQGMHLALMATAGFVALFSLVGFILSLGGRGLLALSPWAGLAVGVALMLLGLWILATGRWIGLSTPEWVSGPSGKGPLALFLFGTAYGIASLSCTLPIFLVVVGGSLATQGLAGAVLGFVSYGLGMGAVFTAVTLGAVLFQGVVARHLRLLMPYVERLSAVLLMGAGGYLVYYWLQNGAVLR